MRERQIQPQTLRLIDANLNRAREAARVIEDIVRFGMDDAAAYDSLRSIRLGLGDFARTLGIAPAALLAARRSSADVGRRAAHRKSKNSPNDEAQIISRNFARLQEALRSLEETARAVQPNASAVLQAWRFAAYDLQKSTVLALTRRGLLEGKRLYALLSEEFSPRGAERTARLLLKGGVDIIQVREKEMGAAELVAHARKIVALCRRARAISIVNDRVDVALAADADGVHLGPEDMPVAEARRIMGANKVVGATTRSLATARRAVRAGADYVAIGPVRQSSVAAGKKPISESTLRAVLRNIRIPVFAIGGIDTKNIAEIMKSGVERVAVCTALTAAGDPEAAARIFLKKLPKQVPARSRGENMKDVLKKIVTSVRADYAEIRIEETRSSRISYKGRNLETIAESTDFGGCVRALVNGGWGFVSFNRIEDVEEKMNMAIRQAEIISKHIDRPTKLAPVKVIEDRVTIKPGNDPRTVALSEKQAILAAYNDIILGFDKRITTSTIDYFDKFSTITFVNSEGADIEQHKIDIGGGIAAVANDGRETQIGRLGFGSSNDFGCVLNKEDEVREICGTAVGLLSAESVKGGQYTVVIDPILAGVFIHEAFGHLSEGDNVYQDKDLQKLMTLGEVYGPNILDVYDSGLDEGLRGYLKYDDEGVKTEKTYLIRHGKLVGRLHSRETAGEMGEEATGSARAMNYRYAPICRMRNTCIENGETPFEDMIKDIKLGVYARKSYGGQTNGEMFTFSAGEAYMIRDGRIAELVKNCSLSGNVFQTLKNIEMVGNDFAVHDSGGGCGKGGQMPLPVSHGSPHIRIKNVVVGGR